MPVPAPRNANYAATVVELNHFVDLPNCSNVKAAIIFGNSVIVSKDAQVGQWGMYFSPETQLSREFLSNNSLYRKHEYGNNDETKTGFFEEHGRVKTMKFRGHKSEGFFIPIESLLFTGAAHQVNAGDTFDTLNGIEICGKYVPKGSPVASGTKTREASVSLEESIVEGQFRFHSDTDNLRRNAHKIQPTDIISITDKWHGTSVVIGKLLVKRELSWLERILLRFGVPLNESVYGLTYSSRKVIKAVNGVRKGGQDYYSGDIWGTVAKSVADRIPNGFTLYGEIVGFTEDGAAIQKGYSYGCTPGQHEFLIYRVTMTSADGLVIELTWAQLKEFASKYGFSTVPEIYYGRAYAMFDNGVPFTDDSVEQWQSAFVQSLSTSYVKDADCPYNPKGTPAEGIVLRIDHLQSADSFKLKNFRFLERESKELDKGEVDTETAETITA